MTKPCFCHNRTDFASEHARRQHEYETRKKKYANTEFPQVERAFEGLEPQIRENREPKSTEPKIRESSKKFTGSDILQIYEAQATIVKTDLETGRIADFSDAVEELETRLLTSGISKDRVKDFVRIFKHRLSAERLSNPSQPKQVIQPQPQPQPREISITERAELEAQKVNAQRGFSQGFICTICGNWYATYEEADRCDKSHSVQNETETPRQQEPEVVKPREISQSQPRPLPQSDILFRLGKSLVDRLKSPKTKPEEKTKTEEQQPQETDSYSPITYLSTVRWQAPEPISTRVCEVCGETAEIGAFLAGHHGKGRCG